METTTCKTVDGTTLEFWRLEHDDAMTEYFIVEVRDGVPVWAANYAAGLQFMPRDVFALVNGEPEAGEDILGDCPALYEDLLARGERLTLETVIKLGLEEVRA